MIIIDNHHNYYCYYYYASNNAYVCLDYVLIMSWLCLDYAWLCWQINISHCECRLILWVWDSSSISCVRVECFFVVLTLQCNSSINHFDNKIWTKVIHLIKWCVNVVINSATFFHYYVYKLLSICTSSVHSLLNINFFLSNDSISQLFVFFPFLLNYS